ncbi:23S rRNA (pseudouridine(1915)-N(3))-methyltransferase RlmH [Thermosipho atlanticus]|uniref:Ribosomal RNA large subunit methyltransferase H n=1 Tax=Thermosipho atlanticus DSM 15807 TaxID=1123380 RepID=A0A1M5RYN3_9BACT|nr:23S rRNA (pseudouridine(1915)-N(3))-methyltransferase RlmH [Thermosipho atlanticus]SHH31148.1 23S rRNA (pseudouridine1915-N3)-methyltransferase [Thermosipho atlanticus DSM 15807]
MELEIIIPGKISKHLFDSYNFYVDKIKRFSKIKVNFVKLGGDLNKLPKSVVLKREAEEILKKLKGNDYVLIDLHGKMLNSIEFSKMLENYRLKGKIHFVIGGPLGIDEKIVNGALERISLSQLTFTHELALIILLEQIFRGFKIMNNENYHY